jgi:AcrR family transcriptional regulator
MSPRTEAQYEEIRKSRKKQIMESALEVFASEGYHRASISKISAHAGISKGLLYNYFTSKEELLMEVLMEGTNRIREIFRKIQDELDTPEELKIFIRGSMDLMRRDPHYYKTYFTVLFQPEAYQAVKENYEKVVGSLMEDIAFYFQKKGDKYPVEKAFVLGALLDGIGLHYLMAPEMYDLEKIEEIIFELFR